MEIKHVTHNCQLAVCKYMLTSDLQPTQLCFIGIVNLYCYVLWCMLHFHSMCVCHVGIKYLLTY